MAEMLNYLVLEENKMEEKIIDTEIMDDEIEIEPKRNRLREFIDTPVKGIKKASLIVGAIAFGILAEKHAHKKDDKLLDEEFAVVNADGEFRRMEKGRDLLKSYHRVQRAKVYERK